MHVACLPCLHQVDYQENQPNQRNLVVQGEAKDNHRQDEVEVTTDVGERRPHSFRLPDRVLNLVKHVEVVLLELDLVV